jgi:hypothetical protein
MFQQEVFFLSAIFVCKTFGNFFLSTTLATECGVTDERYADGSFPLAIWSVKKLPTNSKSHTDGICPSVKL